MEVKDIEVGIALGNHRFEKPIAYVSRWNTYEEARKAEKWAKRFVKQWRKLNHHPDDRTEISWSAGPNKCESITTNGVWTEVDYLEYLDTLPF